MERSTMPARGRVARRQPTDTPKPLPPISRANQGPQKLARTPMYVLYTRLTKDRDFATKEAQAYITGVDLVSGGGPRLHVLIYSRSGRYVHTWQHRRRFGPILIACIDGSFPAYGLLREYLRRGSTLATTDATVRLAVKFLEMLGERELANQISKVV